MPGGDQLEGGETSQDKTMIQQMDDQDKDIQGKKIGQVLITIDEVLRELWLKSARPDLGGVDHLVDRIIDQHEEEEVKRDGAQEDGPELAAQDSDQRPMIRLSFKA